jgi:inosine-uridine nucleoside N-ribohydrolase
MGRAFVPGVEVVLSEPEPGETQMRCLASVTILMLLLAPALASGEMPARQPLPLVFDTDMGNDVDDALALGMIHACECRGQCRLLAVTVTKDHPLAAPFVDLLNTFYGRPEISVGVVRHGATPDAGRFNGLAVQKDGGALRYPHRLLTGADAPEATDLLRSVLASQADQAVVMVQVGFSTNLARLLASGPDRHSPLSGRALVQQKVRLLSTMAGAFQPIDGRPYREYNITEDIASARQLVREWPTPIVFSGFEVGQAIRYPAESIEQDFSYVKHHPLAEAYRLYDPPPHCRPCWDLTSVLYAVHPDRGYFQLSPPGRVTVEPDGLTTFTPQANGPHRYLIVDSLLIARAREAFVELASQPPCCSAQTNTPRD